MGAMRVLLTSPFPRWFLLLAKLLGGLLVSVLQVYAFLAIALLYGIELPPGGLLTILPALVLGGLLIGAAGLLMASFMRRVVNFAGVMNFVIFPVFFASSALYPLWRLDEVSPLLAGIAAVNPFTHAVELIRFALHLRFEAVAASVCTAAFVSFLALAVVGYDPGRGFWARRVVE
jgi:ABC-2 type transport system permease protein